MLEPLIIEPQQQADSAIIWLHGLGSNKYDFQPVAEFLQQQVLPKTRFILPQAPSQPVSLNGGMSMPSWYDIVNLSIPREIDVAQLQESAETVIELIETQRKQGIALNRIILAGFSQGGAVVMHTAYLAYPENVGGVMALSTYAPTFNENTVFEDGKLAIPSLHLHGTDDNVVDISLGKAAYTFLLGHGVDASWHTYSMMHEVCDKELSDIAKWLQKRLP